MTSQCEHNPAVRSRRTAVAAGLAGLTLLAIAAGIALSWRGDLPDPVATHWGIDGKPDDFSSLNTLLTMLLGLGVLLVLSFAGVTAFLGRSASVRRLSAAATVWAGCFLAVLLLGTLHVQRGLADANAAGDVGAVTVVALVGSLALAFVVGLLVPGDPPQPAAAPVDAGAPRERLAPHERAVWVARTGTGPGFTVGIAVTVLTVVMVALTGMWLMLIVPVLLLGLLAVMFSFVVRVDRTGMLVRSAAGWPRTHVPLDEVLRADVTEVRALREFGGWGWRVGRGGRVGIVPRSGAALLVERTGGRSIVVTVADARRGAGLLNALADRERQAPGAAAGAGTPPQD
jgi:hypothetical protein